MAGAFGGDHEHIDIFWRHDGFEMDVEAVGCAQGFAGLEIWRDGFVVNFGLHFIGKGDDDQIAGLHGFFDADWIKTFFDGQPAVGAIFAIGDDDFDAGIAKVLGVGVALRTEADHGDGFAAKSVEGGILFVDHFQRLGHGITPAFVEGGML